MNKNVLKINGAYDRLLSWAIARNERKKLSRIMGSRREFFADTASLDAGEWLRRWSVLGSTDGIFYRYYGAFIGAGPDIVPDDLMHNVIEPILNPMRFRGLYSDKNMFDKLLAPSFSRPVTPRTLLRSIRGGFYDAGYNPVGDGDIRSLIGAADMGFLVAKPTVDSSSGNNVLFYDRDGSGYRLRGNGSELDVKTLSKRLGSDFIIQEGQVQSAAMSRFNDTSINTLRIATYLSVETHEPVVLGGVLRVGKRGSFVDNAHAGGCLVGIGGDGRLCPSCSDQYGNRFTVFNDMDFSAGEYYIPNYDLVRQFAAKVASALPHQRVLALDIMLDADDRPLLIEFNNYAFGVWAFQQTVGPLFGTYTQEVIEHCRTHLKDATRIYLTY